MRAVLPLIAAAGLLAATACSAAETEPEPAEQTTTPQAASSESASPEVETDPNSATMICEKLRIRDAYLAADSLAPAEEAEVLTLAMEANTEAMAEDAEPALREIALEHMDDRDAAIGEMISWCQDNTEPMSSWGDPPAPW
jgi:hypothetical protein